MVNCPYLGPPQSAALHAREQPCFSAMAGCTLFAAHTAKPSANVRKPAAIVRLIHN
jgi:hypothetical protein